MNSFLQQMVNEKVKNLNANELVKYANQYDIPLSKQESIKVIKIIKSQKQINIYDQKQKRKLINKIENVVSSQTATAAKKLLDKLSNN